MSHKIDKNLRKEAIKDYKYSLYLFNKIRDEAVSKISQIELPYDLYPSYCDYFSTLCIIYGQIEIVKIAEETSPNEYALRGKLLMGLSENYNKAYLLSTADPANKGGKDSFRNYPQGNRDNNYSGNRNNSGNDIKNNDNRYSSSKFYYDDGYNRKRFFNDNNYMDKRKSEYKGNSSNYISGNKYSDRQERSRSRSRSWVRNHNRYRRDMIKRDHSHSKSFHKFNDNYE